MQRAVVSLGLDLLVDAIGPGTTVVTPYEWSTDHSWNDKVFSKAQPFLDPEATSQWLERKEKDLSTPRASGHRRSCSSGSARRPRTPSSSQAGRMPVTRVSTPGTNSCAAMSWKPARSK